jgi:hypothetical protein
MSERLERWEGLRHAVEQIARFDDLDYLEGCYYCGAQYLFGLMHEQGCPIIAFRAFLDIGQTTFYGW